MPLKAGHTSATDRTLHERLIQTLMASLWWCTQDAVLLLPT